MDDSLYSTLTEAQKQCLRGVANFQNSKEIALDLGISPTAVDDRIKNAMRKLKVENRADAARILTMFENPDEFRDLKPYQSLILQSSEVAESPVLSNKHGAVDKKGQSAVPNHDVIQTLSKQELMDEKRSLEFLVLTLFKLDRENDLSIAARIVVMILIACAGILILGILMFIAESISSVFAFAG